ncbi:MAG TPA: TonB family protein [Xanthomonadales bacterium]|nr:TonB family protein [Xanthomonadales bacterium]
MAAPSDAPSLTQTLLRVSLPALAVVAAITAAIWWWTGPQAAMVAAPASTTTSVTPGLAADAPDQIEALMLRARTALNERRLVAPAGDNAVEIYLAVLDRQADHVAAQQAMLELIPPAAEAVEAAIASGDLAEARRRLLLVQRMGGSELRLDMIRQQMVDAEAENERLSQAETAQQAAAEVQPESAPTITAPPAATVEPAARAPQIATRAPEPPATPAPGASVAATTPARIDPPSPGAADPVTPSAAPKSAAVVEARQTVDVRPAYPSQARQRRVDGWVELEFAVSTDGKVDDIVVLGSEPPRIFDREAVRAAARWRFEPRRENGVAVATRLRKTVSFKFN